MKRMISVMAVMVAMVAVTAAPAFADRGGGHYVANPAASNSDIGPYGGPYPSPYATGDAGPGKTAVYTWRTPTSEGGDPPKSDAKGGHPGYDYQSGTCHGPACP